LLTGAPVGGWRTGHTSLATTQRYIEVTPGQERRALRVIKF
jgi:hypothetical protein